MKNKNNIPYRHIGVTDIDKLDSKWRKEFERELADGNFLRGGKSLTMYGDGAEIAHEQWAACLALVQMPVFYTDPVEMLRRHNQQYIARDTDESKQGYEEAEALFVSQFFGGHRTYTSEEKDDLVWIFQQAINDGVVLVISTDADEDTTGLFNYDPMADLIETYFEVIRSGPIPKTKAKKRNK